MPEGVALEGAGDCIWDQRRGLFWMGYGIRSDAAARLVIEESFGVRCIPLALADQGFFHLDTAFCALPCGDILYYPGAFDLHLRLSTSLSRPRGAFCSTEPTPRALRPMPTHSPPGKLGGLQINQVLRFVTAPVAGCSSREARPDPTVR